MVSEISYHRRVGVEIMPATSSISVVHTNWGKKLKLDEEKVNICYQLELGKIT